MSVQSKSSENALSPIADFRSAELTFKASAPVLWEGKNSIRSLRRYWKKPMSISLRLMAGPGQQVPIKADLQSGSSLDVVLVLQRAAHVTRSVDLALKLKTFGLGLQEAHRALNRIVADETVQLNLGNADRATMIAELAELGVSAR